MHLSYIKEINKKQQNKKTFKNLMKKRKIIIKKRKIEAHQGDNFSFVKRNAAKKKLNKKKMHRNSSLNQINIIISFMNRDNLIVCCVCVCFFLCA